MSLSPRKSLLSLAATALLDPATNAFLPAEALRAKFAAVGAMDAGRLELAAESMACVRPPSFFWRPASFSTAREP